MEKVKKKGKGNRTPKGGKKGDKVDIYFPDERAIFQFFNMIYKEPDERKDGRAVMAVDDPAPSTELETIIQVKDSSSSSAPKNKTIKKSI